MGTSTTSRARRCLVTVRSCPSTTVWFVPEASDGRASSDLAGGALIAIAVAPRAASASRRRSSVALALTAKNSAAATPATAPVRDRSAGRPRPDTAASASALNRAATVKLEAVRTARAGEQRHVGTETRPATRSAHELHLDARPRHARRLVRHAAHDRRRRAPHEGSRRQASGLDRRSRQRPSFASSASRPPSSAARTSRGADGAAHPCRRSGAEPAVPPLWSRDGEHERNDEMKGAPKGEPVPLDWTGKRSAPATITVQTGAWPTGLYTAQLTTDDGRVGYAPFILRPATAGAAAAARRSADEHLAGLQLLRPRRRRLGRHLVRGGQPSRRARPPLPRPRRAPAFQGVRPRVPALAALDGQAADMVADDDLEAFGIGRRAARRSTTSSSSRDTAST